jgi:queuine tRNA-ribosyltransferase
LSVDTPHTAAPSKAQFDFTLEATDGTARAGRFQTPHGQVQTPVFMPVGTHSAVRSLTWPQVKSVGASMVLCNAYHLFIRPGHDLVAQAGGLHGWMNWDGPILTDSGGFQVFSLAKHRIMTDDGVAFRDPLTGDKHFIGPEKAMEIQNALGADVIMAFDECPPYPCTYDYAKASLEKTNRWLERCFAAHQRNSLTGGDQALFPIVQGSIFEDLRVQSADFVQQFNAHGYAIGGVSVGEEKSWVRQVVEHTAPLLPADKPRYLMGVGTPEDLLDGIARGIDMFDCVMPTRIARHGTFFTPTGRKNIKRAEYKADLTPLVDGCTCPACQHHHKAYLRHLYQRQEVAAGSLLSLHNIHTLIDLARQARESILAGSFEAFREHPFSLLTP